MAIKLFKYLDFCFRERFMIILPKTRWCVSLFFLFSVFSLFGQKADTALIDEKIYDVYANKNDSIFAFSTVDKIIGEAQKINYLSGVSAAVQLKGYLYLSYGNYDLAKKYIFEAYEQNKTLHNDKVMAQNLRILGIYYERKEEYEKALDYFFQSLNLRTKINDLKGMAECNASIGIIFHYTSQIQKAVYYYKKSLAFYLREKNTKSIADIQSNIAAAYNSLGNPDSAIYFLNGVIDARSKMKDFIGLGQSYHNLGISYSMLGNYTKALNCFKLAIKNTGRGENNANNVTSYRLAGGLLIKLKQYIEAEKYLLVSEKISRENGMNDELIENYNKLSELYELKGNFKKSIQYASLKTAFQDSIAQLNSKLSLDEIEAKYKSLEKSHEIELLKARNETLEQQSKYNYILAFSFFILVAISIVLVFYIKTLKDTKNTLVHQNEVINSKSKEAEIQNQNLEKLIGENQTLMGVLAHDLRAPFSKLLGLVNILEEEESVEEKTLYINFMKGICKDALQLIQDTVNISQIYNENAEELKQKMEFFKPSELLENSLNTFKAVALEKKISISFADSTSGIELRSSKEYLGRIFDNLISNAIKFSPANTNITLTSSKMSDKLVFSFKDEGPGFTEADKKQMFTRFKKLSARPTGNEVSSGLGLFIVKQLVDLIGAKIYLMSEEGKGSEFLIELPLN